MSGLPERVLVVNAGSSSLKLGLLDGGDEVVASAEVDGWDGQDTSVVRTFVAALDRVDAVGHRVVHGGATHGGPAVVDAAVVAAIEAVVPLAPLHQRRALAALRVLAELLPGLPAVACFDTAFHRTLPAAAATYALPAEWRERWGLRRYGFHGLSHAYAARRAAELVGRPPEDLRIVSCHLGAGASLCAVVDGRSVDTTMGFTPLEGLVMATRSGSLDPGLVLWLLRQGGLGVDDVAEALATRSGLAGLSGGSGDMREVLSGAGRGEAGAVLALDVWLHRLRREIGAMAASAGGPDVLVFTGGIGEHQPEVRAAAASGLGFLGVAVDHARNRAVTGDADVSADGARARALVVKAREDIEIARQTRGALASLDDER